MKGPRLSLVCLLPISLLLVSCGGTPSFSSANLEGNWYLTGQNIFATTTAPSSSQGPFLATAIGVSGKTVYARGDLAVTCAGGDGGVGGTFSATGQIAPNGSFVLTNSSGLDSIQYTITGTVPSAGTSTWQGSYTLVNSTSSTGCTFDQSGSFTATPYPDFNGTYTGTLSSGTNATSEMQVVVKISQGAPTIASVGPQNLSNFYIPLSGIITVSGSSCFSSGSMANGMSSSIQGDFFTTSFTMNDGSTMMLNGWFLNGTETSLSGSAFVRNGQCNNSGGAGTLTLQQ